jgi:hypothetical protein
MQSKVRRGAPRSWVARNATSAVAGTGRSANPGTITVSAVLSASRPESTTMLKPDVVSVGPGTGVHSCTW